MNRLACFDWMKVRSEDLIDKLQDGLASAVRRRHTDGFTPGVVKGYRNELAVSISVSPNRCYVAAGAAYTGGELLELPAGQEVILPANPGVDPVFWTLWIQHTVVADPDPLGVRTDPGGDSHQVWWLDGVALILTDSESPYIPGNAVKLSLVGVYPVLSAEITDMREWASLKVPLQDGAVTTTKIEAAAVTTAKLEDEAVTEPKIGDASIVRRHLGVEAVGGLNIEPLQIATGHLQAHSITRAKLNDRAVDTEQLEDQAVSSAKLADGAVTSDQIGPAAVIESKLSAHCVARTAIQDAAVGTNQVEDYSVTARLLENNLTGMVVVSANANVLGGPIADPTANYVGSRLTGDNGAIILAAMFQPVTALRRLKLDCKAVVVQPLAQYLLRLKACRRSNPATLYFANSGVISNLAWPVDPGAALSFEATIVGLPMVVGELWAVWVQVVVVAGLGGVEVKEYSILAS